jgi:hypothetical protein
MTAAVCLEESARISRTMKKLSGSFASFLALMAYLLLAKLLVTYAFDESIFPHSSQKATFDWLFISILTAAGLLGVWLAHLTGFPEMWDARVSNWMRFLLPALLGVSFGLEEIVTDYCSGLSQLVVAQLQIPFFHIRFPASAIVYPAGAIIVDTLYRLVPIPLLLWIVSSLILRSKGQERTFWVLAILLSLFEPVTQSGIISLLLGRETVFREHELLVAYQMLEGYILNLLQAWLFRRYGFLACLTMRVSMYLIWHVLWGLVTQT